MIVKNRGVERPLSQCVKPTVLEESEKSCTALSERERERERGSISK